MSDTPAADCLWGRAEVRVAIKAGLWCGEAFWLGVREKEGRVITALSHLFTPPSFTLFHSHHKINIIKKAPLGRTQNSKHPSPKKKKKIANRCLQRYAS